MESYTNNFSQFIATELNPEQREAVIQDTGVLLVCAGAGSGKTRVITARITNLLLNNRVAPSELIALTFTNKAAREMRERVTQFLPPEIATPYVGTFHSYCLRLLKINRESLETPDFAILDADDQKKLLQKIVADHGVQKKINATQVAHAISRLKNSALTGTVQIDQIGDPLLHKFFTLYEQEKKRGHYFDFDDLLLETLKLFNKNPEFALNYQRRVRHVLVDEYQDTNHVQHALLKAIACDQNNSCILDSLCVVGDEDQSIYSWRGATVSNIVNFKKDFPSTKHIAIEQNYRSAKPILDAANEVIKNNNFRNPKKLWSEKPGSDRIRIIQVGSGHHEADFIAALTQKTNLLSSKDTCAVLYRSHYQSRAIEEVLLRNSIPYKIIGGIQFYDRLEVKDLLAYMRLVANPFDRVSFMRVSNTPARGLGKKFEELFFSTWEAEPFLTFDGVAEQLIAENKITGIKAAKLKGFVSVFKDIDGNSNAYQALNTIVQRIDYFGYLQNSFDQQEAQAKTENVKELINAVQSMEQREVTTLKDFLDEVALLQDHMTKNDDQNCLSLMTLHAAKGLEFDTVMLTGLEEGLFPSSRSIYEDDALEEERRLLYVGITRARERLMITHARCRYTYGQMNDQLPSRFLEEIPHQLALRDDACQWRTYEIQSYITQWLTGTTNNSHLAQSITPTTKASKTDFNWDVPAFIQKNSAPAQPEPTQSSAQKRTVQQRIWKKYQPVRHQTLGIGVVQEFEKKSNKKTYLTIKFSSGIKKIDSQFIEVV